MAGGSLRRAVGALLAVAASLASAAAPTPERVLELCAQVEGPAHCGRMVEADQLKSLPNLAVRNGDTLRVSLFPSGTRDFVDAIQSGSERSYSLWDYWSPVNAVVLFVTAEDEINYAVLQRATGNLSVLPAEPILAPDRQRAVTADFCARRCTNEIVVWRVTRDGLRKELSYKPTVAWSDVTATWKDGETIALQYTPAGEEKSATAERKLGAADWQRLATP